MSAGTATTAMCGNCPLVAESRKRCERTWVSRARSWPRPVTSRPKQPSVRKAASKSSASLNTEVALPGISDHQVGDVATSLWDVRRRGYAFSPEFEPENEFLPTCSGHEGHGTRLGIPHAASVRQVPSLTASSSPSWRRWVPPICPSPMPTRPGPHRPARHRRGNAYRRLFSSPPWAWDLILHGLTEAIRTYVLGGAH